MQGEKQYLYKVLQDHTANPIDPSPKITTVDPFSTSAVLQAAPTPKNPNILEVNVMSKANLQQVELLGVYVFQTMSSKYKA